MRRPVLISLLIAGLMWSVSVDDIVKEGVALRDAGDPSGAIVKFEQALKSKAKHPLANFEIGKTYLEKGDCENAVIFLTKAKNYGYDALKSHLALGQAFEACGNNIEAAIEYSEAAKLAPNDPECQCNLARVSQQTGVAEGGYINALKIDPNYVPAMVGLANLYANNNDSVKAMTYFDKAQKTKPDYAPTYFALGNYHLQKKRYLKSIESFTRYIQLEPRKHRGYGARADAYSKSKKDTVAYKHAITDIRQAIALGDTTMGSLKFLAFLYGQTNQHKERRDVLRQVVIKDQYDTQSWMDLARAYAKTDSARGAADAYLRLIVLDSMYAREIAPDLAMAYYNVAKYDSAVIWFKKRLDYDTLTVATYVNLALAYLQLKNYKAAVENFRKSLKLNPKYVKGHLWLGQTSEFLGAKAEAMAEYRTVIKLAPGSPDAKLAREGIARLNKPATPTTPNYQDYWDKYWDDLYKK